MQSIITSYLLQNKECALPGIGVLHVKYIPAKIDHTNKQILPPADEIFFTKHDDSNTAEFIKYISDQKNIGSDEAENMFKDFCKEWKEKINAGEKLHLETIGSIQKDEQGEIYFKPEKELRYFHPIPIDEILVEKEEEIAEEDKTISVSNEYYEEADTKRSYWGIWALIFTAIVSVILFFHFYNQRLSTSSMGNQHHLSVDSAGATYSVPKK